MCVPFTFCSSQFSFRPDFDRNILIFVVEKNVMSPVVRRKRLRFHVWPRRRRGRVTCTNMLLTRKNEQKRDRMWLCIVRLLQFNAESREWVRSRRSFPAFARGPAKALTRLLIRIRAKILLLYRMIKKSVSSSLFQISSRENLGACVSIEFLRVVMDGWMYQFQLEPNMIRLLNVFFSFLFLLLI